MTKLALLEALIFMRGDLGTQRRTLQKQLAVSAAELTVLIDTLKTAYDNDATRGMTLSDSALGLRLVTKPALGEQLAQIAETDTPLTALTAVMLEVLAMIAYQQPVTRLAIDHARGVKSAHIITKLLQFDLITVVGKSADIGTPNLYGTTPFFLDHFGLTALTDLPPLPTELASDSTQ